MATPAAEAPLLAYALLELRAQTLPELLEQAGVCGMPLMTVTASGVQAVVSPLAEPPGQVAQRLEELLQYEGVIRRLSARHTLLPLRFGTLFPTELQLRAWMTQHSALLVSGLTAVEGCVELSIRILPPDTAGSRVQPAPTEHSSPPQVKEAQDPRGPTGHGRAFLEARRQVMAQRDAVETRVSAALAQLKVALEQRYVRVQEGPALGERRLGGLPVLHFLVRRECEAEFRACYREVSERLEVRSLLTGPWPVHHFCPELR